MVRQEIWSRYDANLTDLIAAWQDDQAPRRYPAGSWGPVASIAMITQDGRSWYEDY